MAKQTMQMYKTLMPHPKRHYSCNIAAKLLEKVVAEIAAAPDGAAALILYALV